MSKNKVVIALTGAGISKSAGIPTFQEFPGISEKLSINYKRSNPEDFSKVMSMLKSNCTGKTPTAAHLALAKYEIPIITMNVDGLHKAAKSKYILEIHGSFENDDVVLYGQQIHYAKESVELINRLENFCKRYDVDGILLIIGTSMQTQFANYLAMIAEDAGIKIKEINSNADEEVENFLNETFKIESKYQKIFVSEID